jgi:hypothetical protein
MSRTPVRSKQIGKKNDNMFSYLRREEKNL